MYGEDIHIKMCKKIAQLTKVIYNLNSKAEEHDNIVESMKREYEKNINRIMRESQEKILKCQQQSTEDKKFEREINRITLLLSESEDQNKKLKNALETHIEHSNLNEQSLRSDYENKLLDAQNKFLERKREYGELMDSFKLFQKELAQTKQGKTNELTLKHHQDLKNLREKYEADSHDYQLRQTELEEQIQHGQSKYNEVNEKLKSQQSEMKEEFELKINKLKAFYENELKSLNQTVKEEENEKLQKEIETIQRDNELKKTGMSNRIRYLEKQSGEHDRQIEEYKVKLNELNTNLEQQNGHISTLQEDNLEKNQQIVCLNDKLQGKLKELVLMKESMSKEQISVKENVLQVQTLLSNKEEELEKLKLEHTLKSNQYNNVLNELTFLKESFTREKESKSEIEKQNNLIEEEHQNVRNQQKETIRNLQSELKTVGIELTRQKQILAKTQADFEQEKKNNAENIKMFKIESKNILKESQTLLLKEFEKTTESTEKEHKLKLNNLESEKTTLQQLLQEKQREMDELKVELDSLRKELNTSNEKVKSYEKRTAQLERNLEMSNSKSNNYENLLTEIKTGASDEKKKLLEEQIELEKKYKQCLNEESNKLRQQYEERMSSLKEEHIKREMDMVKENDTVVKKITFQMQREAETLKDLKEKEIEHLKYETQGLTVELNALRSNIERKSTQHRNEINQLVVSCAKEKEQLEELHRDLFQKETMKRTRIIDELGEKLANEKKAELETFAKKHGDELLQLKREHSISIDGLKNHMTNENKKDLERRQKQFDKEKDLLRETLKIQNEERMKQVEKDLQQKIHNLNDDLQRSKELRQKEYTVHANKIEELSQSLEAEREEKTSLKEKVTTKECEVQTIRKELHSKVEEILQIRRECNSRMRCREDEMQDLHEKELDTMKSEHMKELQEKILEWKRHETELEDQIVQQRTLLNEADERYRTRPSRDEDVEMICQLQEKLIEQNILCQQLDDERKHLKLELVNREENFNKVFSNSPNVGFMNPVAISKRKSSKKK